MIVLTGFMAVGKTTVGRRVAKLLNVPFLDLDELVEQVTGKKIASVFSGEGEEVFRWWEQFVLGRLDLSQPGVLATGGGTLIGAWNQGRVRDVPVIVLDAPYSASRQRMATRPDRPLAARSEILFAQRAATYARLPLHVDTRGKPIKQIAQEVIDLAVTFTPPTEASDPGVGIPVRTPDSNYVIHIQPGVAAGIGGFVAPLQPTSVALITDSNIAPLWGATVRHDLLAARLPTFTFTIPAGERHKTLATVATLYDQFAEAGIDRGAAVVALGGGVVGDVAGFVAATWMRGVRGLVHLPTTLLSMVDAAIGGKTGVDHPQGKNLIGAFRQPDLVLADPIFLSTLPQREWRSGLAEVVKHAIIADPALFDEFERNPPRTPADLPSTRLGQAIRVKTGIVQRDPFEQGERAKLNLGHTFGHAYELLSGYILTHGEAVAIGIVTAARLSERVGLADTGLVEKISSLLTTLGLPTTWPDAPDAETIWATMQSDKKKAGRGLRLILPRAIGEVIVTEPGQIAAEDVLAVLAGVR